MTAADRNLGRRLDRAAWFATAVVLLTVGAMRRIEIETPAGWDLGFLPAVHAVLNGGAAAALVAALVLVRRGRIEGHRRAMLVALALSAVFLVCYVAYHVTTPETRYGDADRDGVVSEAEAAEAGAGRVVYLVLLASHIVLAAGSFPFILFTFIRGLTGQVERHRAMARWVFPVWLYVAVSGPVCYLMLRPYY